MRFKLAIATVTLGRVAAGHSLQAKLQAAADAGYDGVELTYECLLDFHAKLGRADSAASRLLSASDIRALAASFNLEIISLQPFTNFDALLDCTARLEVGKEWVQLCAALGARWLQIPSSIYPLTTEQTTSDVSLIADNMGKLADYAAPYSVELAYEAPSWGLSLQTWQETDKVIKLADRPNIRHCLDSFHIATREMFDPETLAPLADGEAKLERSLNELSTQLKSDDIAYVQFSDGCPVDLSQSNYPKQLVDPSQPPFCTWSRNARCHPFDGNGGMFPNAQIARAIFATGFSEGWVAMESFHSQHWDTDESVPRVWAEKGVESWKRIQEECAL